MTPLPPSPNADRPPGSRSSRIARALLSSRKRFSLLCGLLGGLASCLWSASGARGPVANLAPTVFIQVFILITFSLAERNRNPQGRSGVLARRASGRGAMPAGTGLMAGAAWRVMRAAAQLMPRAAGSRWLAEAASFLSEAPPAQRRRALRNYLATAPQVIVMSWAGHLARRTRAR